MKNVIKIFRKMFKEEGLDINEIEVDLDIIRDIANRCYFELEEFQKDNKSYWRVSKKTTQVLPLSLSTKDKRRAHFACLADLHFGNKNANLAKLRDFLNSCLENGVYYVLIAGDLFEGCDMYPGQEKVLKYSTPEEQSDALFEVLRDYNFYYVFCNGNHDYSFEILEKANPNKLLEEKLERIGRNVKFIDSFFCDVIIGGVGIRLVHLDHGFGKRREYPCIKYAQEIKKFTNYDGQRYPILVIVTGHIHKHEFHENKDIIIFQPGSIVEKNEKEIGYIVSVMVKDLTVKKCLIM